MKAFSVFKKIDGWCSKVLGWVMAVILLVQLVILFAGVIVRYFFNSPFIWSDELASLLLVCITFLGGYAAFVSGKLANVTMIVDLLPPMVRKIVNTFRYILIIAVCVVIAMSIIQMMSMPVIQMQVSSVLRLPIKYVYIVMPVSFIMIAFHSIIAMIEICITAPEEKEALDQ